MEMDESILSCLIFLPMVSRLSLNKDGKRTVSTVCHSSYQAWVISREKPYF
jgi:hypothetical protein